MAQVSIVVGTESTGTHDLDDGSDAEVVLTTTPVVASELAAGLLDPNVAFMQGRLKTSGDPGAVLRVLPLLGPGLWAGARD